MGRQQYINIHTCAWYSGAILAIALSIHLFCKMGYKLIGRITIHKFFEI